MQQPIQLSEQQSGYSNLWSRFSQWTKREKHAVPKLTAKRAVLFVVKGSAISIALLMFGTWLALAPIFAMPLYNVILFQPTKGDWNVPEKVDSVPLQELYLKSAGGDKIHAVYIGDPNRKKTILFSHGNGGNVGAFMGVVQMFVHAGYSVLAYDYRGYGKSSGEPTLDGVVEDGLTAYDYLQREKGVDSKNIVLAGLSLGTGVSSQISAKRRSAGLILISGFTDIRRIAREKLALLNTYPDFAFPAQVLNTANVLSHPHVRTLIIHGAQDPLISYQHAVTLKEKSLGPVELVISPEGDHGDAFRGKSDELFQRVQQFL